MIQWFFLTFMRILGNEEATRKLRTMLDQLINGEHDEPIYALYQRKGSNSWPDEKTKITNQEFKMDAWIHGYALQHIMLDVGSNLNILLNKS